MKGFVSIYVDRMFLCHSIFYIIQPKSNNMLVSENLSLNLGNLA